MPHTSREGLCVHHQVLGPYYFHNMGAFSLVLPFIKMARYSSGKCSVDDNLLINWLEKERDGNGRLFLCSFILTTQFNSSVLWGLGTDSWWKPE